MQLESSRLADADRLADEAHRGQLRKDGKTPYIAHPRRVRKILEERHVEDEDILIAALLHDTLEDTPVTRAEIAARFGEPVATLVEALTRPKTGGSDAMLRESYIKRFMAADPRACILKLADRLDNLRDMATSAWTPGRKDNYGSEAIKFVSAIKKNPHVQSADDATRQVIRTLTYAVTQTVQAVAPRQPRTSKTWD